MITHSIAPLSGTRKCAAIAGRLMLTIDVSSVAMKTPIATSAKTVHLSVVSPDFGSMPAMMLRSAARGPGIDGQRRKIQFDSRAPHYRFDFSKIRKNRWLFGFASKPFSSQIGRAHV